jgi:hypothetical protein
MEALPEGLFELYVLIFAAMTSTFTRGALLILVG